MHFSGWYMVSRQQDTFAQFKTTRLKIYNAILVLKFAIKIKQNWLADSFKIKLLVNCRNNTAVLSKLSYRPSLAITQRPSS